jgi:hypothetical protein
MTDLLDSRQPSLPRCPCGLIGLVMLATIERAGR